MCVLRLFVFSGGTPVTPYRSALDSNRLRSLPATIFAGLTALQDLYVDILVGECGCRLSCEATVLITVAGILATIF